MEAVEKAGSEAIYVKTDVTNPDECDAAAKAAVDRFGGIDILINNAAIFGDLVLRPFTEIPFDEWMKVMAVNTGGPFNCTKAVFPYMKEKGGKIINIASAIIFEGVPGCSPLCRFERGDYGIHPLYGQGVGRATTSM